MGLPAMNDDVAPASPYRVGYGRPPIHTRFEPGRSGNPRGRPRGSKNKRTGAHVRKIGDMILDEAYREIEVVEKGRPRTMTTMEAVTRMIVAGAMKGHTRPQKLFMETVRAIEARQRSDKERFASLMGAYKSDGEVRLELCRRAKLPAPLIIPHPSDIVLNPATERSKSGAHNRRSSTTPGARSQRSAINHES